MLADSMTILEQLANLRTLLAVLPLVVLFGTAALVAVYSLAQCLRAPRPANQPARVTTMARAVTPETPVPPPARERADDSTVTAAAYETRLTELDSRRNKAENEATILSEQLAAAKLSLQKEQELRGELQRSTDKLANQLGEVVQEVEHIYHLNLGIAAIDELNLRIGRIREGQPNQPRSSEPTAIDSKNPEKLLIAEQAGEIKKLRDVVAYYRDKYGE